MINAADVVVRLIALVLSPAMLLAPLLFAALARTDAHADEARRAEVRARTIALCIGTLAALALWFGALLAGAYAQSATFAAIARFAWPLFFPLWFFLAMPLLRAKNSAWTSLAGHAPNEHTRTARLDNRARTNPIRRAHWFTLAAIAAACLAAILARGLATPFETEADRTRWLGFAAAYLLVIATVAATLPLSLRALLNEPEPMDAHCSPELARMYDAHRHAKVRGLFYLLGVGTLALFGISLTLAVWMRFGEIAGWLGGLGGTALGIAGAWFGVSMAVHRMRIAQFRSDLQHAGRHAGPPAGN